VAGKLERNMMRAPQQPKIPKKTVRIDCGKYFLRTLKVEDSSDRWASWMADPKNLRLLNSGPRVMTRRDIAIYIEQFDQSSHLLIGIFEKQSDMHIGFIRVDIDHALNRCLGFMMIGEQKYRHWSVSQAIRVPFQDFIFETLGLNTMLGTALASNRPMIRYLLKSGWTLDKTAERHVKSHSGDAMLDLCFLSLSRDAWRAWKKEHLPQK
jgi:RimJ/RimL family protein N-acetyltransferase